MPDQRRPEHRIAKLLARAGIASRREIERMIADGRVALDGTVLDTPATLLSSLRGITVDGNPVEAPAPARLFVYHKPPGLLVTEHDPAGRPIIYDRLPADLPRVVPVGRLDLATEGLLLLTTDGGLKRTLELPATGVERAYRARAYGEITQARLEELIEGVEIEGIRYGPIDANLERRTGANVWIELILTEGKNREVRRVLEHLGLQVSRLIRTRYGPFVLGDLPAGGVGEVLQHDLVAFTKSLKSGGATDVRVQTVARTARQAEAPRATTRSMREPDAPRRAAPVRTPRPVAEREPSEADMAPRPGFRAPRSSSAKETRSARFAARERLETDAAPARTQHTAATRPTRSGTVERPARERPDAAAPRPGRSGSRTAHSGKGDGRPPRGVNAGRSPHERADSTEVRPGRTGPRAARLARAAPEGGRQGSAGGWVDRPPRDARRDERGERPRAGERQKPGGTGRPGSTARPPRRNAPDRPRPSGPRGEPGPTRPDTPRPGGNGPRGKR